MATPKPAPKQPSNIGRFFTNQLGPFPVWAWIGIGIVGIGGGLLVSRNLGQKNASTQTSTSGSQTGTASDTSGLGLAIDPTTGLPYAVEGLVPSGANAGGTMGTQTDLSSTDAILQEIAAELKAEEPPAPTTTSGGNTTTTGKYAHSHVLHDLAKRLGITYDQLVKGLFAESKATNVPYTTLVDQFETGKGDVTTLKKYLPPPEPAPHNPTDPLNGATGPAIRPVPVNKTP